VHEPETLGQIFWNEERGRLAGKSSSGGLMGTFCRLPRRASVPQTHGFADYESLGIPSFSINSYSVGRLTPSSTAAEVIFPR
jgi:hypothetical protein